MPSSPGGAEAANLKLIICTKFETDPSLIHQKDLIFFPKKIYAASDKYPYLYGNISLVEVGRLSRAKYLIKFGAESLCKEDKGCKFSSSSLYEFKGRFCGAKKCH
jgi:hypothetical protein